MIESRGRRARQISHSLIRVGPGNSQAVHRLDSPAELRGVLRLLLDPLPGSAGRAVAFTDTP